MKWFSMSLNNKINTVIPYNYNSIFLIIPKNELKFLTIINILESINAEKKNNVVKVKRHSLHETALKSACKNQDVWNERGNQLYDLPTFPYFFTLYFFNSLNCLEYYCLMEIIYITELYIIHYIWNEMFNEKICIKNHLYFIIYLNLYTLFYFKFFFDYFLNIL